MRCEHLSVSEVFLKFYMFSCRYRSFKNANILSWFHQKHVVRVLRSRDFYENNSGDTDCKSFVSLALHDVLTLFLLAEFQSLLDEPNPNSPANNTAAQLYQENRREYEKHVASIVEESWIHF